MALSPDAGVNSEDNCLADSGDTCPVLPHLNQAASVASSCPDVNTIPDVSYPANPIDTRHVLRLPSLARVKTPSHHPTNDHHQPTQDPRSSEENSQVTSEHAIGAGRGTTS